MSAKTILQIKNLDISFRTNAGVVHAIRGINLDLQKGETVAIVGESGSGKSVTMKAAVGLLDSNATINSGEILYTYDDGHGQDKTVDLLKLSKKQLRTEYNGQRLAMVFQDPMASLDPTITIGKQIMEGMLLHKHMPKARKPCSCWNWWASPMPKSASATIRTSFPVVSVSASALPAP